MQDDLTTSTTSDASNDGQPAPQPPVQDSVTQGTDPLGWDRQPAVAAPDLSQTQQVPQMVDSLPMAQPAAAPQPQPEVATLEPMSIPEPMVEPQPVAAVPQVQEFNPAAPVMPAEPAPMEPTAVPEAVSAPEVYPMPVAEPAPMPEPVAQVPEMNIPSPFAQEISPVLSQPEPAPVEPMQPLSQPEMPVSEVTPFAAPVPQPMIPEPSLVAPEVPQMQQTLPPVQPIEVNSVKPDVRKGMGGSNKVLYYIIFVLIIAIVLAGSFIVFLMSK